MEMTVKGQCTNPWLGAEKLRKARAQGRLLRLPTGARGQAGHRAVCPERPLSSALRGGRCRRTGRGREGRVHSGWRMGLHAAARGPSH